MELNPVDNWLKAFWRKQKFRLRTPSFRAGKTYIVPTQFGLLFGVVALFMLILAMGFANNLIYLFVFLFISVSMISLGVTNKNIDQVVVNYNNEDLIFENQINSLQFRIQSRQLDFTLNQIDLKWETSTDANKSLSIQTLSEPYSGISGKLIMNWNPEQFGIYQLPRVRISSEYPFGLSYAWKFFDVSQPVKVYPAPKGKSLFDPTTTGLQSKGKKWDTGDESDYFLHEKFQSSHKINSIDWKKYYKLQQLLSRKKQDPRDQEIIYLKWDQTVFLSDFSDRLRQMSLWLAECEQKNYRYQIQLPQAQSETARGFAHYRNCLDLLLEFSKNELDG